MDAPNLFRDNLTQQYKCLQTRLQQQLRSLALGFRITLALARLPLQSPNFSLDLSLQLQPLRPPHLSQSDHIESQLLPRRSDPG